MAMYDWNNCLLEGNYYSRRFNDTGWYYYWSWKVCNGLANYKKYLIYEKYFNNSWSRVNHNGDLSLAHKLIDTAVEIGADIIKFQTFNASLLATREAKKADYQKNNIFFEESQQEMLKKLELSFTDHKELIKHCNDVKIEFLSTAFDLEIEFIKKIGVETNKIPSGEINNLPT